MVKTGLEVLLDERVHELDGANVGVLANQSSVNSSLVHITDLLHCGGVRIKALFGPEHGVRGSIAAGARVEDYTDPRLNVPVYSLYGAALAPTPTMLEGLDVMIIDLQDIGSRFFTYMYTMSAAMDACAESGVSIWVLDRPNPISGAAAEGFVLEPEYSSFVGRYPIAQRHSLTIAELALLFHSVFGVGEMPTVVPLQGWERGMWFDQTGLPWVIPAPNIPTPETALVYPGTCLFEGTNVSEGRGTTKAFEVFGAPWIDPFELKSALEEYSLPGVIFREAYFVPTFSKYQGEHCSGLQVHVTDRSIFQPVLAIAAVLCSLKALYTDTFQITTCASGKSHFDLLAGTLRLRESIDSGKNAFEIMNLWQKELEEYARLAAKVSLYPEE